MPDFVLPPSVVEAEADAWLAAWENVIEPEPDPEFPEPCTIKAWRERRILPAVDGTVDEFLGYMRAALESALSAWGAQAETSDPGLEHWKPQQRIVTPWVPIDKGP